MAGDVRISRVDQSAQGRVSVTAETDKATYDVEPRPVAGDEFIAGHVSVKCPLCCRQLGVPIGKEYRCVCGALIIASRG